MIFAVGPAVVALGYLVAKAEPRSASSLALVSAVCLAFYEAALFDVWIRDDPKIRSSVAASLVAVLLCGAGVAVAARTNSPATLLAAGEIRHPGDRIAVNGPFTGAALLELRAAISPGATGAAVYELELGPERIDGVLAPTRRLVTVAARQQYYLDNDVRVLREIRLEAQSQAIVTARLAGPISGPVVLRLYEAPGSRVYPGLLAAAGFVLAAFIEGLLGFRFYTLAVGCALGPGVFVGLTAGPAPPTQKLASALVFGTLLSAMSAVILAAVAHHLVLRKSVRAKRSKSGRRPRSY